MKTLLKNFIRDESGASAAEYALIIAVVGVGIGAAALVLGNNVSLAVGDAANEVGACNDAGDADAASLPTEWAPGDGCAEEEAAG